MPTGVDVSRLIWVITGKINKPRECVELAEKPSEKKIVQWSAKEIKYLFAIWMSTDFQLKLDSSS